MKEFIYMVKYQNKNEQKGIFYAYDKNTMIEEIQRRRELGIIKTYQIYSIKYDFII